MGKIYKHLIERVQNDAYTLNIIVQVTQIVICPINFIDIEMETSG